ncbi:uncharacterized protein LOC103963038 isoform X3 [Pyrus x bretschneideri]|uniref:uncharacterized protein LOC103963038 isoform X3 n=1 Tax=Pyrus x bretschneideri TaxID=225117 RepID=UPI0005114F66|nr:uncharacterized protein LOC103963038 isoform X3 [Pyrus x bretschneideri]
MPESNHDLLDQLASRMEARLDKKQPRWLCPEEICEVLRNPPAIMPPNSTASEDGKSKVPPHATIEEVDKEKDEEGNDINQVWKRPKVSGGQKSHEFAIGVVMCSLEELHQLVDRASAPNTLASSSISNPTIDSQAIAMTRATLEMDFITMAGEVQLTRMISGIQSLVDSNCFPAGTRTMIMGFLKQLEHYVPAYSKAYSEYDSGKNLTDQVEATKQLLQPKVQFCYSKEREFQELAKAKMTIEGKQAAVLAEIHGILAEIRGAIQAMLELVEKFLLQ